MNNLGHVFVNFIKGYVATRYMISLIAGMVIIVYAMLWLMGYVPDYVDVASSIGLSVFSLFIAIYFLIALVFSLGWMLINSSAVIVRSIYRQIDISGLVWFDLILLILLTSVNVIVLQRLEHGLFEAVLFLSTLVYIPILIDLIPIRRPKRAIIGIPPYDDRIAGAIRFIIDNVDPSLTRTDIQNYNKALFAQISLHGNQTAQLKENQQESPKTPKPYAGAVIEIPPR